MVKVMKQLRGHCPVRSWPVTVAALGLLWLCGLVSETMAQPLVPATPRAPGMPEGRRLIETIKIWKMTEALNLDEDQAAKLFPKLAQLEASRRELHRQQQVLRDELAELLKQQPLRDQEVKARLERLERIEVDFRGREQLIRGALRSILSVEQQARLALFEDRFEAEMRRAILHLRQRHRVLPPGPGQGIEAPGLRNQSLPPKESELPRR
jgi:Spy/CpxP family protein refolding chaperone